MTQTERIQIDFGNINSPLPWNNVSLPRTGKVDGLLNTFGIKTRIRLEITDPFNSINASGTQMPDARLGIAPTASADSFFGNTQEFGSATEPTGAITIAGLDTSKIYTLTVFASRLASDNRETKYITQGETIDSALLNVAGNVDQAASFTLRPGKEGTIELTASPGPANNNTYGFFYLGALLIDYQADSIPTTSVKIISPNGGEYWQVGREVNIQWDAKNIRSGTLEYSTDHGNDWKYIDTITPYQQEYFWKVPDDPSKDCLIRLTSDSLTDQSDATFEIANTADSCTIVVLGSSTAAGAGVSTSDSAWVNRYRTHLYRENTRYRVINLARGGYTSYHLLPDGSFVPPNLGISIDSTRNMSKALTYQPSAIIINLPSNDASRGVEPPQQMENFHMMVSTAETQGVPVWVCTTQPRNFSDPEKVDIQLAVRDSIIQRYGPHSIDLWTGFADTNGGLLVTYNSGDGVHLNDLGHREIEKRVWAKQLDTLCGEIPVFTKKNASVQKLQLTAFPNPFHENIRLRISSSISEEVNFAIFDLTGQQVFSGSINPSDIHPELLIIELNLHHLVHGCYIMKVWQEGNTPGYDSILIIKQ